MTLAEQAAEIVWQCTHYNMLTGEGFVQRVPADWANSLPEHPYVLLQGPEGTLIMRKLDEHGRVIRQRVGYDDGSSLLYTWDPRNGPEITTNDRKPDDEI